MKMAELRLLLYLETCIVDHAGRVNGRHMNEEDIKTAKRWAGDLFIGFGRIICEHCNANGSFWVTFSEAAWDMSAKARRQRGERQLQSKRYMRTEEPPELTGRLPAALDK